MGGGVGGGGVGGWVKLADRGKQDNARVCASVCV